MHHLVHSVSSAENFWPQQEKRIGACTHDSATPSITGKTSTRPKHARKRYIYIQYGNVAIQPNYQQRSKIALATSRTLKDFNRLPAQCQWSRCLDRPHAHSVGCHQLAYQCSKVFESKRYCTCWSLSSEFVRKRCHFISQSFRYGNRHFRIRP